MSGTYRATVDVIERLSRGSSGTWLLCSRRPSCALRASRTVLHFLCIQSNALASMTMLRIQIPKRISYTSKGFASVMFIRGAGSCWVCSDSDSGTLIHLQLMSSRTPPSERKKTRHFILTLALITLGGRYSECKEQ